MDNKIIAAKFDALVSDRKVTEETWERIERYIMPLGGGKFFSTQNTEGEMDWNRREVFDDTAILGCDILASSLHGSLTSPATKWFDFTFRTQELNADLEAKTWLDNASYQVWSAIQESNFNLEVSEAYLDLCGFGNTSITHEPKSDVTWDGMTFDAVPLKECYFEEASDGSMLRFYRHLQWRPAAILERFGREGVPESIIAKAENPTAERVSIIFCIYPIEANKDNNTENVLPIDKRPFGFKYILHNGQHLLGDVGGYHEMPAYIVRWRRATGSMWGYGPGHQAISTVMTLNELVSMVLEASEKVVDPAMLVNQKGLLSDLDLQPGGQTVVKDTDKDVKVLESGARFDVSALQVNDLRDMVKRLFHVDQLELKESPAMSATEVMVRYELMNRLLGPTMGRLQNDMLNPTVSNTFRIMYRAKQIEDMPQQVKDAGGIVDIEYVGPLSRAQKSDEVAAIERWLGNIGTLAEVFPPIKNVPNPVEIAKRMALHLNIDGALLNDDDTITQLNAYQQQIAQLSNELEMAKQEADIDATQTQTQAARPAEATPGRVSGGPRAAA